VFDDSLGEAHPNDDVDVGLARGEEGGDEEEVSSSPPAVAAKVIAPAAGQGASAFDNIRAAIMSRADEIASPGKWIGMFEIMAFSAMKTQRIIFQLEEYILDVLSELAPALLYLTWQVSPFEGRMVACRLVGSVWHPASWATCKHFVAAKPLGEALPLRCDRVVAHMGRLFVQRL